MGLALRCLFFLVLIGGLILFLYVYRRRTNAILAIVVGVYAVTAALRLLTIQNEADLLGPGVLSVLGLGLLWGVVWLGARWVEKHGWPGGD